MVAEQVSTSGHEAVQHVINERQEQERSNAARIEFVKGRSIVNATLRAKRSERVSDERWAQWNQHAIAMAAKEGSRIQRAFRSNAPETLRTAFVNETQAHRTLWQHSQEEAGTAIVRTSLVQKAYEHASANLQEQIGSLVSRAAAANLL
jgi:hypothetical protein